MSASSKISLRKEIRKTLKEISSTDHRDKSRRVSLQLKYFLKDYQLKNPHCHISVLGGYAPLKDEVDFHEDLLGEDCPWSFAYPNHRGEGLMEFRQCLREELIETEEFGVALQTPPRQAQVVKPDAVLVPGLAFSPQGFRLGRGKGFYDRFLEVYDGLKVGIAFEEQVRNEIPRADHDENVDFVVSERGWFREGEFHSGIIKEPLSS